VAVKVVVPVSGGKDSQACLKLALREYAPSEIRGLFCDTRFEHPLTYLHVCSFIERYGIKIDYVSEGGVIEKCRKYGRFPSGTARHCTDELKIRPTRKYLKALAEKQGGFEVWYGMRLDESSDRATRYSGKISTELYAPHEVLPRKYPKYLHKMGVSFRLPVLELTTEQVLDICDGEQHPLYAEGFDRIGCFPCGAGGDKSKEKAFAHDDFGRGQRVIIMKLADEIGKDFFNSKSGKQRNGCAICSI